MWDSNWSLSKVILLFTGMVFLVISLQVTLLHYRQNFRHWAMYGPVIAGPLIGLLAIFTAFYPISGLQTIMAILFTAGIALGAYGTVLHANGVGQRVDGYTMQNFLVGPPVTLPAMVAAMSILGLLALYWR